MRDDHEPPPIQIDEFGNYLNPLAGHHIVIRRRSLDTTLVVAVGVTVFILFSRLVWISLQ